MPLVCTSSESEFVEKNGLVMRFTDELVEDSISKIAEVSYGVHPQPARYFSTIERHTVTLAPNEMFPECIITIDRASGSGRHLCLGELPDFPTEPRASTYTINCSLKNKDL